MVDGEGDSERDCGELLIEEDVGVFTACAVFTNLEKKFGAIFAPV